MTRLGKSSQQEDQVFGDEKLQISMLRTEMSSLLKEFPQYDTDFSLLRWLNGYNFDKEMAAENMTWALNTMNAIRAFKQNFTSFESVHEAVCAVTPVANYFPGGPFSTDKNGCLLNIHNIGLAKPQSLLPCVRVSEFYIAAIYDCEGSQCIIRQEEAKKNRKLGTYLIVDLNNFSYDVLFHLPATRIYINMLLLLQRLFPDTAKKLYIVNGSVVVNLLYKMVKMALSKETVANFEVLDSNWKEILVERHGAENLPASCGGTKSDDILRKGGEVPSTTRALIKSIRIPEEKLTKVYIPARCDLRIPIEVKQNGVKLCWYFTCSSGDIDFAILRDNKEVWPTFRISTEWMPEFGEIICEQDGVHEIYFSNRHGRIWTKQIQYTTKICSKFSDYSVLQC